VLSSSSVSLVASFVDAFLDFISTLIIFISSVAMGRKGDRHKYPAGKKRFEPLGVLVFSVTMIASFVQVSHVDASGKSKAKGTASTGFYRVFSKSFSSTERSGGSRRFELARNRVSPHGRFKSV